MLTPQDASFDMPSRPPRPVRASLKRGLRGRCPACGEGRLLSGYLAVNPSCPACGEEFHHQRADDFPQYVTIFVVAHLLCAALLLVDDLWPELPLSVHFAIWPLLVVALSLVLLPRVKGALIAYQWALRMHGFETAHSLSLEPPSEAMVEAQPGSHRSAA